MRPKYQNFEELVKQNKQELLEDEDRLKQLELRLDKKQSAIKSDRMDHLLHR
ncbi:FbpB family small basic protein [Virgibacillus doumboii]|uniref:FbpB family small basic protein n=1 Tax=Virgibacillus doumboii TaxID=2697503 RepID=UPI0013DEB206|nr:FbpB family small basic protein [Virgibacillus doumboii]